ncbi:Rds1 protein [Agrocybe pediades]|nr:Rds1 protein [Agrocybe pediades]
MKTTSLLASLTSSIALASAARLPVLPPGGLNVNGTPPVYHPLSDFDFQSFNLALNQEWIELDLFRFGRERFSDEDFHNAGLTDDDINLIGFMAQQEVAHGQLFTNMIGPDRAAKPCKYQYPFDNVRDFFEFSQRVTRFGEAGTLGFLEHLNSRDGAQMILQTITTESRQQMAFRQLEGLHPMPVDFQTGITQSMHWTLLAPYITECPAENPRIEWMNFPGLNITNAPNATEFFDPSNNTSTNDTSSSSGNSTSSGNNTTLDTTPAITHDRSEPLTSPGREILLSWELPGKTVGYNNSYTTNTTAGPGKFVAWISQLNTTYTPLTDVNGTTGKTVQPDLGTTFGLNNTSTVVNSTMFVLITDANVTVTPANMTMLDPHVVAGPAIYTVG